MAGNDIGVLRVWSDYTGAGVKVGVIDDGVQHNHPDLVVDTTRSSVPPGVTGQTPGTPAAGLIAESWNTIGGAGIAPSCSLAAYQTGTLNAELLKAYKLALTNGEDITSNSSEAVSER